MSQSKLLLNAPDEVIGVEYFTCGDSQDFPAEGSKARITFSIPRLNVGELVNATVDFDHKPGLGDGEVHDHATNGMLSANGEAVGTQLSEGLPCPVFRRIG